ncbi:hypothetical protein B0H13DRAFT_1907974 [Mycena leptocephala]|nr:hypothetical protein B0H13DRAFT_1907974 [Mycena leptocephala]
MAPSSWTTPGERKLLGSYLPLYLTRQAEKKLHKFWPIVAEAFLQDYPEETRLGFNKATATPEQWTALKDAIEARKRRIATWFRYQKKKIATTPVARRKSENSLASTLFNPKPARRRIHHATEVYQKRNGSLINKEVAKRVLEKVGDALGDMAMDVDESDEVRAARIKAGKSERMRVRTEVVRELLEAAPASEHEAIAATIQKERDELSLSSSSSLSPVEAAEARSVEEKQLAIDESNDVVEKVLQALGVQTGWFSFCIWGGPNPRLNGNLSLKCATYGETPAGNDFIAQHATFEESISEQFQVFLRRCFVDGDRRPSLMTPNEASQGVPELGDDVLATASASPPVQAKEKTKKRKASKSKKRSKHNNPPGTPAATISAPTTPARIAGAEMLDESAPTFDEHSDSTPTFEDDFFIAAADYNPFGPAPGLPRSLPSPSAPVVSPWPTGMPPPTSPSSAGRLADAERGGPNGATYASPPAIDPSLLLTPQRPGPRPCYKGAEFPSTRNASSSPTQMPATMSVGGFNFPVIPVSSASRMASLFDTYREHVSASPTRRAAKAGPLFGPLSPRPEQPVPQQPTPSPVASPSAPDSTAPSASVPSGSRFSAGAAAAAESQPVYFQSRPMVNPPKPKKVAQGRLEGVRAAVAMKAAKKLAAKKVAVRMAAARKGGGKSQQQMAPLTDITNALSLDTAAPPSPAAAPLPPTPVSAPPTFVHTMGNETRDFNRRVDAEKASRDAEKAREASRLHNPAGGADLVIITRPARERKAPARADAQYIPKTTKLTRAQQLAAKNDGCLEKLLARGKKNAAPAASEELSTKRKAKGRKNLAGSLG